MKTNLPQFYALTKCLVVFIAISLSGCSALQKAESAVADVEQGEATTGTFVLTEEQAVRVVTAAFKEGWPDKEVVPYPDLNAPYSIKLRFALDREHIIVIPNTLGSQTTFSVINRGTAPVVGVPARKKLVELINKHAANMSGS